MGYFCTAPDTFGRRAYKQKHGAAPPKRNPITADRSALAVVPEIDHGIGKGLEGVMDLTEAIKAKQEPAELVFPGKHPLDRVRSFVKYRRIEQRLAASLGLLSATSIGVDVG